MPFTSAVFGRKLALLRVDFGQDIEGLSTASGISADRLDALERGQDRPTGDEVLILADHFRKDFRFLISDEAHDPDEGVDLLFREHGSELSPNDRIAISEFAYLCRNQATLEQLLEITPQVQTFEFQLRGTFFKGQGQACAEALRKHLKLGEKEVVRDVFATIRQMGIKVFRRRLENSNISGLYMNHPHAGPCVLVNLTEGIARQRFSAAHEWGHALMDKKPVTMSMVGNWTSSDLTEVRANTFASNILMPVALLGDGNKARWADPKEVSSWAQRLRVSIPALLSALHGAGLIDDEQRSSLRISAVRLSEPPDPELEGAFNPSEMNRKRALLERGLSKNYVDLCFDARIRGMISGGLLAEMLLSTPAETHEIAVLFGRNVPRD